jgi:hypothetical protein
MYEKYSGVVPELLLGDVEDGKGALFKKKYWRARQQQRRQSRVLK